MPRRGWVRYPARSSLGDPSGDKLGARPIDASPVWCWDTDLCIEPIAEDGGELVDVLKGFGDSSSPLGSAFGVHQRALAQSLSRDRY